MLFIARRCTLLALIAMLAVGLTAPQSATPAAAATSQGITAYLLSNNTLVAFTDALPGNPAPPLPITGITTGETLVGIDVRPQNALLYALGVNATTDTASLYLVSPQTGVATVVGTAGSIALTTNGTTAVDLPDPAIVGYGLDFNPAADRLRVVAGSLNFRINPNTGLPLDGDNTGTTSGTVTGINPDGAVNGGTTSVDATAYTNNVPNNGGITTQYTLDATSNSLFIQNSPNSGTETNGQAVTVGGATLDFTSASGFDIAPGVNTAASNAAVTAGSAYAALTVGGTAGFYQINLVNAQATLVGTLAGQVQGLALWTPTPAGITLNTGGTALLRFLLTAPGSITAAAINGIASGEELVGIDTRPQTGQLYGLGVNATANAASLYILDPQNGQATVVGSAGGIAFVDAGGAAVDLPAATAGYGFDFNPTVDRLRVTTGTGLNFRVNPNTGAPVDGDGGGAAGSVAGINTDGPINGLPTGSTGIAATAYTNNYGQPGGGTTTQYTLDAASDSLYIQNLSNSGTQTSPLAVTENGTALDFDNLNGFDIPPGARTAISGARVSGDAYALLGIGGTNSLYRLALESGVATSLGTVGTGPGVSYPGLVVSTTPPTATLSATSVVTEGVGTVSVTIATRGGTPLIVSYETISGTAVAGSDYTPISGTLVFATGPLTQVLSLPILDDSTIETTKTVQISLYGPSGIQSTISIAIADDDTPPLLPVVAFSAASFQAAEGSTAQLSVTLSFTPTTPVSVTYGTLDGTATAGSDYTAVSGTLLLAAGQSTGVITVPVTNDLLVEGAEAFTVSLQAAQGATLGTPATATVTIVDDDTLPPVVLPVAAFSAASFQAAEGSSAQLSVTLSFTPTTPVSVTYGTLDGTATAGSDYTAVSGTLLLAVGQRSGVITVPITRDLLLDSGEAFSVVLQAAQGATLGTPVTATVTITPDAAIFRSYLSVVLR